MAVNRITLATDGREAWERQPGESELKFGRFSEYLHAGRTRTPKKTVESLNKQAAESGGKKLSVRSIQEDSYRYRWPERATAFDRSMDAQWQAALFEHGRRMVQEHLKTGRELLAKAQEALATTDPAELSPMDLVRFMDLYSKMTRVALGEPESSVAVTGAHGGPVQITAVPGDEASREAQMRAATLELGRRLGLEGVDLDEEAVLELPE